MAIEDDLGVRSACYILDEQRLFRDRPKSEWVTMQGVQLFAGRYDPRSPGVREAIRALDEGGWEIGLHGSYESFDDPERLRAEKATVESVLGRSVLGGRQHYLNLKTPDTWAHQRSLGLRYDCSLGISDEYGFHHGYGLRRPFGDEFVVFPLTVMEQSIPDPGADYDEAWQVCEDLLQEAREEGAVMSVLWHLRHLAPREFPGHRRIYRNLIRRAQELGAWVGSPGAFYDLLDLDDLDRWDVEPTGGAADTAATGEPDR
ncbi:polysaccharide deacetylase family protein [Halobaculum litoreum]|uniref:Polysaccharide deacetylase family protein n=1 Tax=Halobaculum litoreum TaxID=3031998 RepID=A0ABD5XRU0_9EURY